MKKRSDYLFDGEESFEPIEFLIDGVLSEGALAVLFGASNIGKTFLALNWAVHIAAGLPWHSRPTRKGTVVYISPEGGRGVLIRKHAAKAALGISEDHHLPIVIVNAKLHIGSGETDHERLATRIAKDVDDRDLPPVRLVIIDTLAQNMAGEENSAEQMAGFCGGVRQMLRAVSDTHSATGLVLHHTGHADKSRARGSYALLADIDTEMKLQAMGNGRSNELRLECTKMRDDERFQPVHLRLNKVAVEVGGEPMLTASGAATTTLVVEPHDPGLREAELERAILTYVGRHPGTSIRAICSTVQGKTEDIHSVVHRLLDVGRLESMSARNRKGGGLSLFLPGTIQAVASRYVSLRTADAVHEPFEDDFYPEESF